MASSRKPKPMGLDSSNKPDAARAGLPSGGSATPGPLQSGEKTPGPRIELQRPHHFPQTNLTCWASAIASWLLVKGIVKQGFTDEYLINYYQNTSCTDSDGMLDGEAAIEGVFGEWRLALDMSGSGMGQLAFDFQVAERLIRQHGHFVLCLGTQTLHVVVVYGVEQHDVSKSFDFYFSLLIVDPISKEPGGAETRHHMFLDYPLRFALGLAKSRGTAPCRSP